MSLPARMLASSLRFAARNHHHHRGICCTGVSSGVSGHHQTAIHEEDRVWNELTYALSMASSSMDDDSSEQQLMLNDVQQKQISISEAKPLQPRRYEHQHHPEEPTERVWPPTNAGCAAQHGIRMVFGGDPKPRSMVFR